MIIILRACEANISAQSISDGKTDKPRWNGKYKSEIIRKCYASIQPGLTPDDTIIVANDKVTEDTINWMKANTVAKFIDKPVRPSQDKQHPYKHLFQTSINTCIDLVEIILQCAKENPDDLIYICEDDYLHRDIAITAMKSLYSKGYKGFYAPQDYPDRYTIDSSVISNVVAFDYGHLRSIPSATLTFAGNANLFTSYAYDMRRAAIFSDDSWTWKAFAQNNCFCPIPGHATHLQEGCITPFIDWAKIYEDIVI